MELSCILRQILIQCSLVVGSISEGMVIGQLSGMVAALQSKENELKFSQDTISWIASITGATTSIGLGLAAFISTRYGRRSAISLLTFPIIITWIMLYYATHAIVFIASRALVGIFSGGVFLILYIATAEYASKSMRPLFLYIVTSVAFMTGIGLGHILCVLLHWRTVTLIAIIPAVISCVLPIFWVESPPWLASKGRFEECETSFKALHGHSEIANAELNILLDFEKIKRSKNHRKRRGLAVILYRFVDLFAQKSFWNICFLSLAAIVYRLAAGKYLFNTLAITILQDLTGNDDILLFTLLVDGFFILGSCLSCLLINRMKMRTLMFSAGALSNVILISLSFCIYLDEDHSPQLVWLKCILLTLYLITVNSGPYPILDGLSGEIYPLKSKSYYIFLFGIIETAGVFLSLKLSFDIISVIGYYGLFFINAFLAITSLVFMWFSLPETKGRTLVEIEMFFENNTFENADKLMELRFPTEVVSLADCDSKINI